MDSFLKLMIDSYGLFGLLLAAPVVGMIWLWRDTVRLNTEMRKMQDEFAKRQDDMGQRVAATQEKRVDDSHKIATQLVDIISEHAAAQKETNLALDRIGDMVSALMRDR